MTFNWEESPNKEYVIKKSIEYLKNSDKIIVVGYSFPDDNRSFDLNWIDKIDNKTEIIIQNPANEIPFIDELKERNIKYKIIKDVNKYYIPNELLI